MIETLPNTYAFRLGKAAYRRIGFLAVLLLGGFFLCGLIAAVIAVHFFPTYPHTFTFYLKWQDVLVALCWYITFLSLCGCLLVQTLNTHPFMRPCLISETRFSTCWHSGHLIGRPSSHHSSFRLPRMGSVIGTTLFRFRLQ